MKYVGICILWPFGLFYGHLVHMYMLWPFGECCGILEYFSRLGTNVVARKIWQPWSRY
jgi:hypothetical protein